MALEFDQLRGRPGADGAANGFPQDLPGDSAGTFPPTKVAGLKSDILMSILEEFIRTHNAAKAAAEAQAARPIGASEFLNRASPGTTTTEEFINRANAPRAVEPPHPGPGVAGKLIGAGVPAVGAGVVASQLSGRDELPPGFKYVDEGALPPGFKYVDEAPKAPFPEGYDPLAATAGVSPAGTPTVDQLMQGVPSWAQKALEQSQRDRAAYAAGGVKGILKDLRDTQDLASGFSDAPLFGLQLGLSPRALLSKMEPMELARQTVRSGGRLPTDPMSPKLADMLFGHYEPNMSSFDITNEKSDPVARMWVQKTAPDKLFVNYIGALTKKGDIAPATTSQYENTLGTKEIMSLVKSLKEHFPDAREVGGFRVGGARRGDPETTTVKLR